MPKYKVIQEWTHTVEFDCIEAETESIARDMADNDPHTVPSKINSSDLVKTTATKIEEN